MGLRSFLVAIQSFVRRKYPRITCVEISEGEEGQEEDRESPPLRHDRSRDAREHAANFDVASWSPGSVQSDQHMRIVPVVLTARPVRESTLGDTTHTACILCESGDIVERRNGTPTTASAPARAVQATRSRLVRAREDGDADAVFRAWLLRFYTVKVPAKVPYVDEIMSRYRGRHADLKAQLCAKYGSLELTTGEDGTKQADSSSSSSSGDDSDDSDTNSSGVDEDLQALSMSSEWLHKFYQRYQPEKLLHVDKVLKQFSGREDTLKSMLLAKYCSSPSKGAAELLETPAKRQKVKKDAAPSQPNSSAPNETDRAAELDGPSTVFVDPQAPNDPASASASTAPVSSLCYVIKCVDPCLCPSFSSARNALSWTSTFAGSSTTSTLPCGSSTVALSTTSRTSSQGSKRPPASSTHQCLSCTFPRSLCYYTRGTLQTLSFPRFVLTAYVIV